MPVRVEQVTKTKSGKAFRVLLGGKWYNAFIDSGIDAAVGKMIEAEITTSDKFGPGIAKWTYTNAAAADAAARSPVPPPTIPVGQPAVAAPYDERNPPPETYERVYAEPVTDNVQPWYMPFVSNTVAHAIEKGLIQSPVGINEWALKAAQVAQAIKEAVK